MLETTSAIDWKRVNVRDDMATPLVQECTTNSIAFAIPYTEQEQLPKETDAG
jgi:hypothetical protein